MGFESINYQYVPAPENAHKLSDSLLHASAVPMLSRDSFVYYVLKGPNHWIDIETGMFADLTYASGSIRIALCNPPAVLDVLRHLLSTLLSEGGGYILDKASRRRYASMDEASWQSLTSTFDEKRAQFHQYFGDFTAAISADDVFSYIKQHSVEA